MIDSDLCKIEDRLVRLFSEAAYILENNVFDGGMIISKMSLYGKRALTGATLSSVASVELYKKKLACVQKEAEDILAKKSVIEGMEMSESRRKDLERAFVAVKIVSGALERERVYLDGYSAKLRDLLMVDHGL